MHRLILDKVWKQISIIEEMKKRGDYERNIPDLYPVIADPGIVTSKQIAAHRIGNTQFTTVGYIKLPEIHQVDSNDEGDQPPIPT